jgi:predicted KAP-like P-loop ATPase
MTSFEALYDRKCQTPLYCGWIEEEHVNNEEEVCIQEITEKMKLVQDILKAVQNRQKSYITNKRRELKFQVGDLVFLKLTSSRGILRHSKRKKLSSRYIGPFQITEKMLE